MTEVVRSREREPWLNSIGIKTLCLLVMNYEAFISTFWIFWEESLCNNLIKTMFNITVCYLCNWSMGLLFIFQFSTLGLQLFR